MNALVEAGPREHESVRGQGQPHESFQQVISKSQQRARALFSPKYLIMGEIQMFEIKMEKVYVGWATFLFVPETYNGDVKFKLNIVIPKDHPQLPELKAGLVREIKANFSSTEGLSNPLVDCDKNGASVAHPFLKKCYSMRLNSKYQPRVTDLTGKRIKESDGLIVPGCLVDVDIKIQCYNIHGKKIISRYLNAVTFIKARPQTGQATVTSSLGTGAALNSPDELSWITSPAPQVPQPSQPTPDEEEPWSELNKRIAKGELDHDLQALDDDLPF